MWRYPNRFRTNTGANIGGDAFLGINRIDPLTRQLLFAAFRGNGRIGAVPKSSADPMLGKVPPPRRTRPRDRRDQILRAAGEIFAEKGFHSASLAEIARQVGITPAALYRHFPSKQHLLGQALLSGLRTTLERLEAVPPAVPGAADERLSRLMDLALEFRGLPRLWQLEVRNLTVEDRAEMLTLVRRLIANIDESIRHRRPDLAPADSMFLAWVTVSIGTSTSYHNVQLPKERSRRLLAVLTDAILTTKFAASEQPACAAHVSHGRC